MFINNLLAQAYFNFCVPYVTILKYVGTSRSGVLMDSLFKTGVHVSFITPFQVSGLLLGTEFFNTWSLKKGIENNSKKFDKGYEAAMNFYPYCFFFLYHFSPVHLRTAAGDIQGFIFGIIMSYINNNYESLKASKASSPSMQIQGCKEVISSDIE